MKEKITRGRHFYCSLHCHASHKMSNIHSVDAGHHTWCVSHTNACTACICMSVCTCLSRRTCIGGERTTWAVTPQSLATLFGETGPPPGTCEVDEAGWPADPRTCLSPLPRCWDYKHTTMPGFFKVWILGIKVAR